LKPRNVAQLHRGKDVELIYRVACKCNANLLEITNKKAAENEGLKVAVKFCVLSPVLSLPSTSCQPHLNNFILFLIVHKLFHFSMNKLILCIYTVRSESRCALRLRYLDLIVSIEVAVEVCCRFSVFSC
jgi:hypothetical protein